MESPKVAHRTKVTRGVLDGRDAVKIVGPFDSISDLVMQAVQEIIEEGRKAVVFDLSEASHMTSQGIACLIKAFKLTQPAGCSVYLSGANADMVDLIHLARVEKYLTIL